MEEIASAVENLSVGPSSSSSTSPPSTSSHIDKSIEIIIDAIRIFGPSSLVISFNGGKDACVILYLLMAALKKKGCLGNLGKELKIIYFEHQLEFKEVYEFLSDIRRKVGADFVEFKSGKNFKDGMQELVDVHNVKAVIMGTREGDPYTQEAEYFQPSSSNWPAFMRVNPILRWSYEQVWGFLRQGDLPYCILYDEGYTSIGNTNNTVKNPALKKEDGSYLPAYQLVDGSLERNSRI